MGSTEGIRIGEALLDYAERLWSVGITLEAACDSAEELGYLVTDAYEGRAQEEMSQFVKSLCGHLGNLSRLYMKAGQYAVLTYDSLTESDRGMGESMKGRAERGGGAGTDHPGRVYDREYAAAY